MKNLTHDKQQAITANNVCSFLKPLHNSVVYTDQNTSSKLFTVNLAVCSVVSQSWQGAVHT
jgi:hypothetical protein